MLSVLAHRRSLPDGKSRYRLLRYFQLTYTAAAVYLSVLLHPAAQTWSFMSNRLLEYLIGSKMGPFRVMGLYSPAGATLPTRSAALTQYVPFRPLCRSLRLRQWSSSPPGQAPGAGRRSTSNRHGWSAQNLLLLGGREQTLVCDRLPPAGHGRA